MDEENTGSVQVGDAVRVRFYTGDGGERWEVATVCYVEPDGAQKPVLGVVLAGGDMRMMVPPEHWRKPLTPSRASMLKAAELTAPSVKGDDAHRVARALDEAKAEGRREAARIVRMTTGAEPPAQLTTTTTTAQRDLFEDLVETATFLSSVSGWASTVEVATFAVRIELRSLTPAPNGRYGSYGRAVTIHEARNARTNRVLAVAREMVAVVTGGAGAPRPE